MRNGITIAISYRMQGALARTILLGLLVAACSAGPAAQADSRQNSTKPFITQTAGTFESPFAMAFLPDGSALVTEKAGKLQLWRAGQPNAAVSGVPKVKVGGQGGLLGVTLSPGFARDRMVYLTYSEPNALGGSGLALARGTLATTGVALQLQGVKILWHDPQGGKGGQFGGIVAFAPDGKSLFLTSGERQRFTPAQDANSPLGKILHLTLDGQPAAGNPGAGKVGSMTTTVIDPPENTGSAKMARGRSFSWTGPNLTPAESWSSGHRNPYGLAFDDAGHLWESELGPQGGDELNLIKPALNYGWPNVSNGSNYDDSDIPDHRPGDGYEPPKLWWNPSISPSGLMIYRGDKWPQWKGDAFIPALSGQALLRVHLSGETATKADQWDMGTRVRGVAQSPTGDIYVLEDGPGAKLLKLDPVRR